MKEPRRYGQWAGNEKGIAEDVSRCIKEVSDHSGWHYYQCHRKRGYGPDLQYCKQHAKQLSSMLPQIQTLTGILAFNK